ncbi:MAG: tetratricopeptide repeat protein [Planctomycetales bacterium]
MSKRFFRPTMMIVGLLGVTIATAHLSSHAWAFPPKGGGGGGGGHGGGGGGGNGPHAGGGGGPMGGGGGGPKQGGAVAVPRAQPGAPVQSGPAIKGNPGGNVRVVTPQGNTVRMQTNNRIVNQNLANRYNGGTSVRVGTRNFNLANQNYRVAHFNHPWYRGYWNGNWGWGSGWGYGRPGFYAGYRGGPGIYGWGGNWGYGLNGIGGWGNGYYGYRPLGWGLGAWGLGGLAYNSGYLSYYNPYYRAGGYGYGGNGFGYNYSTPINVAYDDSQVQSTQLADNGINDVLDPAIAAFKEGNYEVALDDVNQAISQNSRDPALHEFRALVLFAMGRYQEAAAVAHSVLALGPGWDWNTVSSFYADPSVYTSQYRKLETFVKSHPQDGSAKFLLAYHYLTTGHPDAAAEQLQMVAKINPNDNVSRDLLKMINGAPKSDGTDKTPGPEIASNDQTPSEGMKIPADKVIEPQKLAGTWTATRENGDKFTLVLTPDSQFTWNFQPGKSDQAKPATLKGKASAEGNVLSLESQEGGSLMAVVDKQGDNRFNFKLLGGPDTDKGLNFSQTN